VGDEPRITFVVESFGDIPGEADALFELTDQREPVIA